MRISQAQDRPARDGALGAAVADWCRAAGCEKVGGFWRLPPDLEDGYALRELKRIAANLGLLTREPVIDDASTILEGRDQC